MLIFVSGLGNIYVPLLALFVVKVIKLNLQMNMNPIFHKEFSAISVGQWIVQSLGLAFISWAFDDLYPFSCKIITIFFKRICFVELHSKERKRKGIYIRRDTSLEKNKRESRLDQSIMKFVRAILMFVQDQFVFCIC